MIINIKDASYGKANSEPKSVALTGNAAKMQKTPKRCRELAAWVA